MFVGRAMSDSGECVCWVGVRVGFGVSGEKKTYYLVGPFEIADFRGE